MFLILSLMAAGSFAQGNSAAVAARKWRLTHEHEIIQEFSELLAIPNVASDRANIQHNAEVIAAMMEKRGVHARLIASPNANPIVFGEICAPRASRTIVLY